MADDPPSCPECAAPLDAEDAPCPRCGAQRTAEPEAPESPPPEERPLPPFRERALAALTAPRAAFRHHHAGWGWSGPWLLVSLAGVLCGLLTLATVDLEALARHEMERGTPPEQRQALEEDPEAAEAVETWTRFGVFLQKTWAVVGPPLTTLFGILSFGGLVFVVGRAAAREAPPDPMRCLSLAAYCALVHAVGYAAEAAALLLGNPTPSTSLAHAVDPHGAAVASAALARLDPIVLWYYALLGAGLTASGRLRPGSAWVVAGGAYLLLGLLQVAGVAAGGALGGAS